MSDQSAAWSRIVPDYEAEFVDPYRADVDNPLQTKLGQIEGSERLVVADLGCGKGPLLPFLAERFRTVWAVDFAEGMLQRAKARCEGLCNIQFLQQSLTDLAPLHGQLDVAVAVNSLVLPDARELDEALRQVRLCLRARGRFLGIVPAMDGVHYYTMLLLDRALGNGKPVDAARKNAAHFAEHQYYDFAFGLFRFRGIEQHFWQPFEIPHRLARAGFRDIQVSRVHLSWKQFRFAEELKHHPAPWDWFFDCRVP
jgi:SAM-dependent methyltransferase